MAVTSEHQQTGKQALYVKTAPTLADGERVSTFVDNKGQIKTHLGTKLDYSNDEVTTFNDNYSYKYQGAAAANIVVKASAGFLHAIILGKWVTGGTVEVSDHASDGDGAVKIKLTSGATDESGFPKTVIVDAKFSTGICADTIGTTDVTFIWR